MQQKPKVIEDNDRRWGMKIPSFSASVLSNVRVVITITRICI